MKDFSVYMFNPQPEPPARPSRLMHNQNVAAPLTMGVSAPGVYVEEVSVMPPSIAEG